MSFLSKVGFWKVLSIISFCCLIVPVIIGDLAGYEMSGKAGFNFFHGIMAGIGVISLVSFIFWHELTKRFSKT